MSNYLPGPKRQGVVRIDRTHLDAFIVNVIAFNNGRVNPRTFMDATKRCIGTRDDNCLTESLLHPGDIVVVAPSAYTAQWIEFEVQVV